MKIGVVSEHYYPSLGGIQEHVHHFAREATRQGHQVTIMTSRMDDLPPADDAAAPAEVIRIARSRPVFWNGSLGRVSSGPGVFGRLRRLLREREFDVVHVHNPQDPVLPLLAVRGAPGLLVGTFHTNFTGTVSRTWCRWIRGYLERLDAPVAVSRACVRALAPGLRGRAVRVIPNGVDVDWFAGGRPRPELDDGRFNILFVGRLDPRNGFDRLLRAFVLSRRALADARLVVVGGGPLLPRYRALVGAELAPHVVFAGPVREERPDWYASAHVLCAPTSIASFGVTLLEAMSAGRPVLAADIDGFREVVTDGGEGERLDPFDAESWANALVRLRREPERAAAYGANGRRTALRYAWPRVASEVLELYRELGAA